MNCSHQALDDGKVVVHDLGERSQAIGGARGIGDNLDIGLVFLLVDAHDEHSSVCGGCRDDDLLGTPLQVSLGLLSGGKNTGGLDDIVCASVFPWDVGRVLFGVKFNGRAIDNEVVSLDLNCTFELAVLRIVFEHVGLRRSESVTVGVEEVLGIGFRMKGDLPHSEAQ